HGGPAAGIKLQLHRPTFIGVIAKAHQRSGACETVKRLWSALCAGERYDKTRCGVAIGCTANQPRDCQQRGCDEGSSQCPLRIHQCREYCHANRPAPKPLGAGTIIRPDLLTSRVGLSRHIALLHELGRYWSKADVVTSHMTPSSL